MSHVEQSKARILDLSLLLKAVEEIVGKGHAKLVDASTYKCYPRGVGTYPMPEGMTIDEWGKCEKKVVIDGIGYEIGLVRDKTDKKVWRMRYDFYGPGQPLLQHFGNGLSKLNQKYTELDIRRRVGMRAGRVLKRQTEKNGDVFLMVQV